MVNIFGVVLVFVVSLLSAGISGMITFGDAIIFYLLLHLIKSYTPQFFNGIQNLSEAKPDGSFDPISDSALFMWAIVLLTLRGVCMTVLMTTLVWKERRVDYLKFCLPLASVGTWIGCTFLTRFGTSPYLPYVFALIFGTFSFIMVSLRIIRMNSTNENINTVNSAATSHPPEVDAAAASAVLDASSLHQNHPPVESFSESCDDERVKTEGATPRITNIPKTSTRMNNIIDSSSSSSANSKIAEIEAQIEAENGKKELEDKSPAAVQLDPEDEAKLNDPQFISKTKFWLSLMCLAGGFSGGMSNIASSPLVIVVISYNFPKTLARGTLPFIFLAVTWTRLFYAAQQGDVNLVNSLPETAAMISGGLIALAVGNRIAAKLSSDQFILIVTCMLLLAALTLGNAPSEIILVVLVLEVVYYNYEFGGWKNDDDVDDRQQEVVVVVTLPKENERGEINENMKF